MLCFASALLAQSAPRPLAPWVERSNRNARLLLDVQARFTPEDVTWLGVESADERVLDLTPGHEQRERAAYRRAMATLRRRLARENDPRVRLDLEVLIHAAAQSIRGSELEQQYQLPYLDVAHEVYDGLRALLDERVPPARQRKALLRLRRYAGLEPGSTPIAQLAQARIAERLHAPGAVAPARVQVEKDLQSDEFFVNGIAQLFRDDHISGYEPAFDRLQQQLAAYAGFVRRQVLPRSRDDFRLPPPLYAFRVAETGVDIPPAQLVSEAHVAFTDIQAQMQKLAPEVARRRGWQMTDYRDVVRALRGEQIPAATILPFYQRRLHDLEDIIRREHIVTLPARPVRLRLATPAESAALPAPFMRKPRLVGNTGEQGEFVITVNAPVGATTGSNTQHLGDWSNQAVSWTLTAHEARPGHELQFDSMVEQGVSLARALFADTSVTTEGWGLYAEDVMRPYFPLDGQLMSLQLQLLRAARAFLDPELQEGRITPGAARQFLIDEVAASGALADSEVERYTFRLPGQATSYFYGFMKWRELHHDVAQALGPRFDQQKFHDFVISQGLLPPAQMREAVFQQFVPSQLPSP